MTSAAGRFYSLDIWRGAAALAIVIYHATTVGYRQVSPLSAIPSDAYLELVCSYLLKVIRRLDVSVPIFFAISGYCIAAACERAPFKTYLRRRFLRIYPTYWIAFATQIVLMFAVDVHLLPGLLTTSTAPIAPAWSLTATQWIGNLTLTETWRPIVFGDSFRLALNPAWTLCYEEQCYLMMGLVALAPRKYFMPLIAAISLVSVLLVALFFSRPQYSYIKGFFFDFRWLTFAAGVVVQIAHREGGRRAAWVAHLLFSILAIFGYSRRIHDLTTAGVFSSFLLASVRWDRQIYLWKGMAPLKYLGRISYSLYLTHVFFARGISQYFLNLGMKTSVDLVLIVVPLAVLASVLYAAVFFHLVERHFVPASYAANPAAREPMRKVA